MTLNIRHDKSVWFGAEMVEIYFLRSAFFCLPWTGPVCPDAELNFDRNKKSIIFQKYSPDMP